VSEFTEFELSKEFLNRFQQALEERNHAMMFVRYLLDQGIKVSALCPMGVKTRMLENADGGGSFLLEGALEPEFVAEAVMQGLEEERFLILPHPEVAEFMLRKATDYDRWLRGMRRLQANVMEHK